MTADRSIAEHRRVSRPCGRAPEWRNT